MKRYALIIFALLTSGLLLHAENEGAPFNFDLKGGLAHWQVALSEEEGSLTVLPNAGKDGEPGNHLNTTSAHPKASAETERFPVAGAKAYRVSFWSHNLGKRTNAGDFGALVRDKGNEALPLSASVAPPEPPIKFIYLWRKEHFRTSSDPNNHSVASTDH